MWTTGVTLTSSGPPKGYSVVVLQVGYMNISSEFGRRGCQEGDPNWACWHDNVAKKTGGSWYSTTKEGYGTSWKVAQVVKRVNKTCADNSINNVVEKAGRSVFASLGAKTGADRNVSSSEWITAWYTTILGPGAAKPGGKVAGLIGIDQLVDAWDVPFLSNEADKGGCPALPVGA